MLLSIWRTISPAYRTWNRRAAAARAASQCASELGQWPSELGRPRPAQVNWAGPRPVLWDSVSPASHSSSVLLSPTTLTHVGHTHRTTIPSLLSERHKLAPSGSPAGAVANPRPVPAVKTLLGPQPRVRRLLVRRSWSTSATANDEDSSFQISDSSSEIEVSGPQPFSRHVPPNRPFQEKA